MKLATHHLTPLLQKLAPELGVTDTQRLEAISTLVGQQGYTDQQAVLSSLYPHSPSQEARTKAFARLRERFNELAEAHQLPMQLKVSDARSEGGARSVWFEGEALLEAQHTTPESSNAWSPTPAACP